MLEVYSQGCVRILMPPSAKRQMEIELLWLEDFNRLILLNLHQTKRRIKLSLGMKDLCVSIHENINL